ncbi:MAG: PAS domain S-box protein [Candidatus Hadarchaeota archaeon]
MGHRVMAAGAIGFLIATLISLAEFYFLFGPWIIGAQYISWVVALSLVVAGGLLRGKDVKKVYSNSWLKLALEMPHGKFFLFGATILVLAGVPVFLLDTLFTPLGTQSWLSVANASVWALAFVSLALGERKYWKALQSPATVSESVPEELLREDIGLLRAYSDLTNRFIATTALVTGFGPLKDAFLQCSINHEILGDCELGENGFLRVDNAMKTLDNTDEKRNIKKISAAFAAFNTRLMEVYSGATSPEVAKRAFENIYNYTNGRYISLKTFPVIANGMPAGVLEGEKLKLAPKVELEQKVIEKITELKKTSTELEQAEQELRESENRFRELVNLLPVAIIEMDKSGKLTFVNPSGFETFGYTQEDLSKGLSVFQLLSPNECKRCKQFIEKLFEGKKPLGEECAAMRKDGSTFPALVYMNFVKKVEPVSLKGVIVDITHRKQVEEIQRQGMVDVLQKLQQAQKVEKVGRVPERLQRLQAESIDIIKKHIMERPAPVVEAYKEYIVKPMKKQKKTAGKRAAKRRF